MNANNNELGMLLEKLERQKTDESIINILQSINAEILKNYYISIAGIIITPMLVEAYYYKDGIFEDNNTYKDDKQKGRKGLLFFHPKDKSQGIDICLSNSDDYYLSILVKNSVIGDIFYSQEGLYDYLYNQIDNITNKESEQNCFKKREKELDIHIANIKRKNTIKQPYGELSLASLQIDKIKEYPFDNKEIAVKAYLDSHFKDEREKMCKYFLGYRSSFVIGE